MLSWCCHSSSRNNFTQASCTYFFLTDVYVCFFSHGPAFSTGKPSVCPRAVWDLYWICSGWAESHCHLYFFKTDTHTHIQCSIIWAYCKYYISYVILPNLTQTSASSPYRSIVLPSSGGWWDGSNSYNCSVRCVLQTSDRQLLRSNHEAPLVEIY